MNRQIRIRPRYVVFIALAMSVLMFVTAYVEIDQSKHETMEALTQEAQLGAVRAYNSGIALAHEVADQATADPLTEILKMEEGHVDWAEVQREQMGLQNYLTTQS